MKLIKTLTVLTFVAALMAGPLMAGDQTCCQKAAAAGKECEHKCCIEAHKEGKSCSKCNPDGEDLKKKDDKKKDETK